MELNLKKGGPLADEHTEDDKKSDVLESLIKNVGEIPRCLRCGRFRRLHAGVCAFCRIKEAQTNLKEILADPMPYFLGPRRGQLALVEYLLREAIEMEGERDTKDGQTEGHQAAGGQEPAG